MKKLVLILIILVVIVVIFKNKSEKYSEYLREVPGYSDNVISWSEHGKLSKIECKNKAKELGHFAFGYRNEDHPDDNFKGTCWTNSFVHSTTSDESVKKRKDDKIHTHGCTHPTAKFSKQCLNSDIVWGFTNDVPFIDRKDIRSFKECREEAKRQNKTAFFFRTDKHPDEEFKNTCGLYDTDLTAPLDSNIEDVAHVSACTDKYRKISDKCLQTEGGSGGSSCFSSNSIVETYEGMKNIMDIQIGDEVKTMNGFEKITSILHKDVETKTTMLKISTKDFSIEMSEDHLINAKGTFMPAGEITLGTMINNQPVESIEEIETTGFCAPLTPSGTILVNNIEASCYVQYGMIKNHDIIHGFMQNYAKKIQTSDYFVQTIKSFYDKSIAVF